MVAIAMRRFLYFFLTILNITVSVAFWYFYAIPIMNLQNGLPNNESHLGIFLQAQANHYSMLQIYLVIFSIILAIAAFLGYNEIRKQIDKRALKRINQIVPKLIKNHLDAVGPEIISDYLYNHKIAISSEKTNKETHIDELNKKGRSDYV